LCGRRGVGIRGSGDGTSRTPSRVSSRAPFATLARRLRSRRRHGGLRCLVELALERLVDELLELGSGRLDELAYLLVDCTVIAHIASLRRDRLFDLSPS
jgi:hypothetical protein